MYKTWMLSLLLLTTPGCDLATEEEGPDAGLYCDQVCTPKGVGWVCTPEGDCQCDWPHDETPDLHCLLGDE